MTDFRIEEVALTAEAINCWSQGHARFRNWPVVYTLSNQRDIYVGESLNAAARLRQHSDSTSKKHLRGARIVFDETFNKSVCLDLESFLIKLFAGDGHYSVLNGNHGVTDADYYGRETYQGAFLKIFDALRELGAFTRSMREIENDDLFKLSPFKALTQDQAVAVEDILEGLFDDLARNRNSEIVIQGGPGTGKTVVAIYLMKLLADIQHADLTEPEDADSLFSDFFTPGYPELLDSFKVGLVVPQQSLRKSVERVFRKTPGLHAQQVLTPFQVGNAIEPFDLLIVDEAHRLGQRAAQAAGPLNAQFAEINRRLFGSDDLHLTQLDWIAAQSRHQIFLVDEAQAVRPADLPREVLSGLVARTDLQGRRYPLASQMRVRAGDDYVGYIRALLWGSSTSPRTFPGYDLQFFDDPAQLRDAILQRDHEVGLARLIAGYAWLWNSKTDPAATDITLGGLELRWNSTAVDWINSPGSSTEVGSIHTVQGYDLNYAGVIIGKDLRFDPVARRVCFDRSNYFDRRGMSNNGILGITYDDDDILTFVRNIYAVLLTRGILGTYVYVCDEPLREVLRPYFNATPAGTGAA